MAQTFNISAACKHLTEHSQAASIHLCAHYTANAMSAGGLKFTRLPSAYMYAQTLPSIGFRLIATKTGRKEQNEWWKANVQAGDIAVMAHGQHGHICMYSGKQWISDFRQNNPWVYSDEGTVNFFRFTGETTTDPEMMAAIAQGMTTGRTASGTVPQNTGQVFTSAVQGNIFASADANAFSLATIEDSSNARYEATHTRIYSTNNSTIVLDELSLPIDDGTGGTMKGTKNTTDSSTNSSTNTSTNS